MEEATLLVEIAEENQIRKGIMIAEECADLDEAIEKLRKQLGD